MDARWLRYFIAIAESGSFSQAARMLGIAQPALSRHVRQMEQELGVSLLVRTARGVTMTEEGERLHSMALDILRQLDMLPQAIGADRSVVMGRVVIGVPTSASAVLSQPLLRAAMEQYPQVQIHLVESLSGYLDEWVQAGRLDMAILYDAAPRPNLRVEPILSEDIWLIGAASALPRNRNGITFRELEKFPLIIPGLAHSHRQLIQGLALKHEVKLQVVADVDSLHVNKGLVAEGRTFTLLARSAVAPEIAAGILGAVRVRDPSITRSVSLARPLSRGYTRAADAIASLCIETAHELREEGVWHGRRVG